MTTTSKVSVEEESLITRLTLLMGQSFFLGLTLASIEEALVDRDPVVQETAIWAHERLKQNSS